MNTYTEYLEKLVLFAAQQVFSKDKAWLTKISPQIQKFPSRYQNFPAMSLPNSSFFFHRAQV